MDETYFVFESYYNYDWTSTTSTMFQGTMEECKDYMSKGNAGYGGIEWISKEFPVINHYVYKNNGTGFPKIYSELVFRGIEEECKNYVKDSDQLIIRDEREKMLYDLMISARYVTGVIDNLSDWDDDFGLDFINRLAYEEFPFYPDGCPDYISSKLIDRAQEEKANVLTRKWSFDKEDFNLLNFFETLILTTNMRWTNIMQYSDEQIMKLYVENSQKKIYPARKIIEEIINLDHVKDYDPTSLYFMMNSIITSKKDDIATELLAFVTVDHENLKKAALEKKWTFEGDIMKILEKVISDNVHIKWSNIIHFTSSHIMNLFHQ